MGNRKPLLILLFAAFALSACSPHVDLLPPGEKRPPNARELFYTAVAFDFHDPGMCRKIADAAIDENGPDLGSRYWRVTYQKSACFFYLAQATHNAAYCRSVREITVLPSNHSSITRAACFSGARSRRSPSFLPPPPYFSLGRILQQMGYRTEDIYAAQYDRNKWLNPVFRFYQSIRATPAFKSKIEALPSYAEPPSPASVRPANPDEMLFQMVAIDGKLPALCAKISPNAFYILSGAATGRRDSLRDNCYFSVAADTNSLPLCNRLTPEAASPLTRSWIHRQGCILEVKLQLSPNFHEHVTYGPVDFSTMAAFVAALRKLGYENPFLTKPHSFGWSDFYRYLVYEAPPAIKQKFLARAESLPSFTH
jgi:hypothetical protein